MTRKNRKNKKIKKKKTVTSLMESLILSSMHAEVSRKIREKELLKITQSPVVPKGVANRPQNSSTSLTSVFMHLNPISTPHSRLPTDQLSHSAFDSQLLRFDSQYLHSAAKLHALASKYTFGQYSPHSGMISSVTQASSSQAMNCTTFCTWNMLLTNSSINDHSHIPNTRSNPTAEILRGGLLPEHPDYTAKLPDEILLKILLESIREDPNHHAQRLMGQIPFEFRTPYMYVLRRVNKRWNSILMDEKNFPKYMEVRHAVKSITIGQAGLGYIFRILSLNSKDKVYDSQIWDCTLVFSELCKIYSSDDIYEWKSECGYDRNKNPDPEQFIRALKMALAIFIPKKIHFVNIEIDKDFVEILLDIIKPYKRNGGLCFRAPKIDEDEDEEYSSAVFADSLSPNDFVNLFQYFDKIIDFPPKLMPDTSLQRWISDPSRVQYKFHAREFAEEELRPDKISLDGFWRIKNFQNRQAETSLNDLLFAVEIRYHNHPNPSMKFDWLICLDKVPTNTELNLTISLLGYTVTESVPYFREGTDQWICTKSKMLRIQTELYFDLEYLNNNMCSARVTNVNPCPQS